MPGPRAAVVGTPRLWPLRPAAVVSQAIQPGTCGWPASIAHVALACGIHLCSTPGRGSTSDRRRMRRRTICSVAPPARHHCREQRTRDPLDAETPMCQIMTRSMSFRVSAWMDPGARGLRPGSHHPHSGVCAYQCITADPSFAGEGISASRRRTAELGWRQEAGATARRGGCGLLACTPHRALPSGWISSR